MKRQSILVLVMTAVLITAGTAFGDLSTGLVAHWKFDEGTGSTANDSAGVNHGTVYGASWTTAGAVGGALQFDGAYDYVTVPDNASQQISTNQITVSGWIKLNAEVVNTQSRIICKQELAGPPWHGWGLEIFGAGYNNSGSTGNQLNWHDSNGSHVNHLSPTDLNVSQWYHVAVTDNAGLVTIYVDGQQDYSSGSGAGIPAALNAPIQIGTTNWNPIKYYFFNGVIDELRVYNRALSREEIAQLAVPAPGAVLLGMIGLSAVGLKLRKFA